MRVERYLALLAAFAAGAFFGQPASAAAADEAGEIAVEAYVYGYPLVTMEFTRRVMTNAASPVGTHAPMDDDALGRHLGYAPGRLAETYPGTTVVNHEWWKPETFADLGRIPASRIEELSAGRLSLDVRVRLNRAAVDHGI